MPQQAPIAPQEASDREPVTQLLRQWGLGDQAAFEQLLPIVNRDLRRLARHRMRREPDGSTLQPTVLVHEGLTPVAAALEASRLRFRPILMTSLAFILGVAPLAFSTGAGAAARQSIGTGVLGGMLAATFLAVFLVPLFFKLVNDWNFRSTPDDFKNLNKPLHNLGVHHE